eukprot:scaffold266_cov248-Pinguiococcus_pyrenoidosus.AAC.13
MQRLRHDAFRGCLADEAHKPCLGELRKVGRPRDLVPLCVGELFDVNLLPIQGDNLERTQQLKRVASGVPVCDVPRSSRLRERPAAKGLLPRSLQSQEKGTRSRLPYPVARRHHLECRRCTRACAFVARRRQHQYTLTRSFGRGG